MDKANSNCQRILSVAEEIFAEKGINNTSLADIASKAGISKGTLYYYYTAKNDLIYDIAERHLNQINDQLNSWIDEIKERVVPEEIMALAFQKIAEDLTRSRLHVYLLQEAVTDNIELRKKYISKYNTWRNMIKSGLIKLFKEREKDVALLADIMLAAMDGLSIQSLLGIEQRSFVDISEFILRGIKHYHSNDKEELDEGSKKAVGKDSTVVSG